MLVDILHLEGDSRFGEALLLSLITVAHGMMVLLTLFPLLLQMNPVLMFCLDSHVAPFLGQSPHPTQPFKLCLAPYFILEKNLVWGDRGAEENVKILGQVLNGSVVSNQPIPVYHSVTRASDTP